jgi:hypothetical protein
MPTLSTFFGIIIRMCHDDHPPPHIHVEYQGFEALVDIASGRISAGDLPRKVAAIVQEWCLVLGASAGAAKQLGSCSAV